MGKSSDFVLRGASPGCLLTYLILCRVLGFGRTVLRSRPKMVV